MIESISDVISVLVCIFFTAAAAYWAFSVSDRRRDRNMREREERYYRLSEELDDDYGDDHDMFYYE